MGRVIQLNPKVPRIERTADRDSHLAGYLSYSIEDGISCRHPQEAEWREGRRQYAAIPRQQYRSHPIPAAPNIEIPLGATHCDALYAQVIDTIYSGDPLLTVRSLDQKFDDAAKAMQRWVNYVAEHEVNLRFATDHSYADCIQLGTAGFYIPFTSEEIQTKVTKVTRRGPRIIPIAPENLLFMGGSRGDIEADQWVALRFWMTPGDLNAHAKKLRWDTSRAMPVAMTDWVRQQYEHISNTSQSSNVYQYFEIWRCAIRYDYHNDGVELDLEVIFDRSSQKVLDVQFYPYDERAIVPMRYQLRPHLAYGLGVMAMLRPHQYENTEVHNYRLVNMYLANTRCWSAVEGTIAESLEIYPGKVVPVREVGGLQEHRLSDVYPSSAEAEGLIQSLAERRVGTEGQAGSSRGSPMMGTRTPGITALSQLQAANRRFTPPFDQMKLATAEALRQSLLRQRERLLMGDRQVEDHIRAVLNDEAEMVINLLRMPDFRQYVAVDFTAASPQTNREADRQAMTMLSNFMFGQYYKPAMELLAQVVNPQSPPEMREISKQIIQRANEMADKLLRTFDQIRDPRPLLLDTENLLKSADEAAEAQAKQNPMMTLMQQLGAGADPGQSPGPGGAGPNPDGGPPGGGAGPGGAGGGGSPPIGA